MTSLMVAVTALALLDMPLFVVLLSNRYATVPKAVQQDSSRVVVIGC